MKKWAPILIDATVVVGLVGIILAPPPAAAATVDVPILNPSFEADVVADGADTASLTGWTTNAYRVWNPTDTQWAGASDQTPDLDTTIPDGRNVFVVAGGAGKYVTQVLSSTFAAGGEYDLSAYFGARKDEASNYSIGYALQILRGDTHAILAQSLGSFSAASRDSWRPIALEFTAPSDLLGVPIEIRATNNGSGWQFSADKFSMTLTTSLDETIPEPATMGLALLGLAGLSGYVRRRRAR